MHDFSKMGNSAFFLDNVGRFENNQINILSVYDANSSINN